MFIRTRSRRSNIITVYVLAVVILFCGRQVVMRLLKPANETVEDVLIFISDTDSIDASRKSNSVYRIQLDGRGQKRIVGSIPHGGGYLRTTDIDCHAASQALVIASHRHDLNGFHHALLDGSGLHLDKPDSGVPLTATRQIAIAPDGMGILVSRRALGLAEPRFNLVAGDLFTRQYSIVKLATTALSYQSPDWSPDGLQIAYIIEESVADARISYRLAISKPDGSDERILYETTLALTDVAWSPDGEWLALEMSRQIYKLRPDGSELTQLSSHRGGASHPRWSPNGERISFVAPSSFPGFNQLIAMDDAGRNIQQVANIRGEVVNGCWV